MFTVGFELEFLIPSYICNTCEGEGYTYCPTCEGEGFITCPFCEGEGYVNADGANFLCPECGGRGSVECEDCYGTGETDCPDCRATGRIANGEAVVRQLEKYGADVGYDSSIECYCEDDEGRELRSPVFDFFADRERLHDFVHTVTSIIKDGDGESSADYKCGLHVHAAPIGGWTQGALKKLYRAWVNWAEDLFIKHFRPATRRLLDYAYRWKDWIKDYDSYVHDLALKGEMYPDHSRYMTLNVCSLHAHGTIEFRLFDGTLDASEILEAITWVGTLVEGVLTCEEEDLKQYFEEQLGLVAQAA